MFVLKRNVTGYSSPARDYEKRCKVTIYLPDNQIKGIFFANGNTERANFLNNKLTLITVLGFTAPIKFVIFAMKVIRIKQKEQ